MSGSGGDGGAGPLLHIKTLNPSLLFFINVDVSGGAGGNRGATGLNGIPGKGAKGGIGGLGSMNKDGRYGSSTTDGQVGKTYVINL